MEYKGGFRRLTLLFYLLYRTTVTETDAAGLYGRSSGSLTENSLYGPLSKEIQSLGLDPVIPPYTCGQRPNLPPDEFQYYRENEICRKSRVCFFQVCKDVSRCVSFPRKKCDEPNKSKRFARTGKALKVIGRTESESNLKVILRERRARDEVDPFIDPTTGLERTDRPGTDMHSDKDKDDKRTRTTTKPKATKPTTTKSMTTTPKATTFIPILPLKTTMITELTPTTTVSAKPKKKCKKRKKINN